MATAMDPNSLNVIVPSEPLKWWPYSKIANWRHFVDVGGIKDANPKELSIFDWKIIFEIALRSSTWRLCPSIVFGESCEVPIFGIIQEVDFVTCKAIFRLHPRTTTPLLQQHAKFIYSRRDKIPPSQATEILKAFESRIDMLQIRIHVGVLDATDGTPGADFPEYASSPSARKSVKDMLSIVLKESGLRKTILDAFVEKEPSVPSFVFSPSRSLSGSCAGGVQSSQPTHTPPPQFPLGELHSLISKPQSLQQRHFDPNIPSTTSSPKRTRPSTPIPSPQPNKRICPSPTRTKALKSSRSTAAVSSPLVSEVRWNDTPSSSPSFIHQQPLDLQRFQKSPSICPSIDSGIDINTPAPVLSKSPEPLSAQPALEAKEHTLTIIPDKRSSNIPQPSNKTTLKVRRVSLNNDELTIYKMDSSFAPVTRQQAAIELNKTPVAAAGAGSVGTLGEGNPQGSLGARRSLSRDSKDTDGEDSWYDTHEEMEVENPQEPEPEKEAVEKGKQVQSGARNTVESPKPRTTTATTACFELTRFGLPPLRGPPGGPKKSKKKNKKKDSKKKKSEKGKQKQEIVIDSDYTDAEDLVLDSDTPTLELLCDSDGSEDHRDRKYRRRERKKLKAEKRKNMETKRQLELIDEQVAMMRAELKRREVLEAAEGAPAKEIIEID
ncbi:hypothetical protein TWF481_010045 [Arthrobotrys musiformis]|uniref:BZIP domain-containing protein n=1 Tax=Arthrobotrys musiformis TaxID=47236 RepID=A0AAV9W0Z0_9PEZI